MTREYRINQVIKTKLMHIEAIVISLLFLVCFFHSEVRAAEEGLSKSKTYKKYLDALDKSRMESILEAKDTLIAEFRDAQGSEADEALRAFENFLYHTTRTLDRLLYTNPRYQSALWYATSKLGINELFETDILGVIKDRLDELPKGNEEDKIQALKEIVRFKDYGLNVVFSEGDWYLVGDSHFLLNVYTQFNTKYAEYLAFSTRESMERIGEDAGLVVPWDSIRKRLIRWEEFLVTHPEVENDLTPRLNNLLSIYLCGVDNTPPYYLWNGPNKFKADENLVRSYEAFIKENKDSRYYPIITQVYSLMERNGFRLTRELMLYLESVERNCSRFEQYM